MNKKLVAMLSALSLCITVTACSNNTDNKTTKNNTKTSINIESLEMESVPQADTYIKLDASTTVEGQGAEVNNNKITITKAGTYSVSGKVDDGQIIVDAGKEDKVYIILNGADITCKSSAPIYVKQAKRAIIALADSTENNITDGENYVLEDSSSDEPNAAIFSKDDLAIIGNGKLTVNANYNNGIASKDDLKIQSGNIVVNAKNDGIKGKDCINVTDGNITINSEGDGMQSNNDTDESKGYVYIEGGKINITSGQDGIQAQTQLLVSDGDITIKTGGGSEESTKSNKQQGFKGDKMPSKSTIEESVSMKGLKASTNIIIDGGNFNIDSIDDSIHSNENIVINNGDFKIAAGDDGIHSDTQLDINGGTIDISKSYEGIESTVININDGNIHIISSDDGLNAAGGNDVSTETGMAGNDKFSSSSNGELNINGGYLYVDASGDGLDANGSIKMSGGTVLVNGPVNDGNGSLDYDGTFDISGGVLVAAGSSGMAQTPSDSSSQNSLKVNLTQQQANSVINVKSSDGKEILTYAPSKQYSSVIISTPDIKDNTKYSVSVGGTVDGEAKDGLYSDSKYSGGTEVGSETTSSAITNIIQEGASTNTMGVPGGRGQRGKGEIGQDGGKMMPNTNNSNSQLNNIETTQR